MQLEALCDTDGNVNEASRSATPILQFPAEEPVMVEFMPVRKT